MTTLTPNTYSLCPTALIVASLTNRKHFDPVALQALADNIHTRGIDQPIIVRALPGKRMSETFDTPAGQPKPAYEIVSGERRYRAACMYRLKQVPVILRQYTDVEAIEAQLIENIQRESLSELDEAEGFDVWLQQHGITNAVIADKISKSVRYVQTRLQLLKLQPETKQALRANQIDVSRALLLAPVHDPKLQLKALDYAATVPTGGTQPSVRDLALWLRQNVMLDLARAPFQITAVNLVPLAGSCKSCPKRTGADPDMFSHVDGADVCTDPPCYNLKADAHLAELQHQADKRGMRLVQGSEAKAICYEKSSTLNGYSPLSQVRNDLAAPFSGKRLEHLLSPSPTVPIAGAVLIENPYTRELIAAIPTAEAEAALVAKGLVKVIDAAAPKIKADAKASKASYEDNVKRIKANAEGRITDAYEELLEKAVVDRINSTSDDEAPYLISAELLRAAYGNEVRYYAGQQVLECMNIEAETAADLTDAQVFKFFAMFRAQGDTQASEALARDNSIDIGALKHQASDKIKAEVAAEIAALKPAVKPPSPKSPLAQPSTAPAADAKAKTAKPKGKAKLSAKDAQLGIAEAMQGIEAPPADGAVPLLAVGQKVTVCDAKMLRPILSRFAGLTGTITARDGDEWQVKLDKNGRGGGVRQFMSGEIEVTA